MIITRAYYAVEDVKTPVVVGAFSIIINLVLSVLFLNYLSHAGLALANSLAATANTVMLFLKLKKHLPYLQGRKLLISLGKTCLASLIMALLTGATMFFFTARFDLEVSMNVALAVMTAITVGLLSYVISIVLLKAEEVCYIKNALLQKFKRN
jgi:putative peptidoglycan lipid II flippase